MPYATETKFFTSDTPGAPALYADAGAYVALLDAILVNGYGAAIINQIVVTDGVAVATTTLGHKFRKWQVARNTDAGHPGLNGEFRVIAAAGASYTFEVVGVPNGTYTGGTTMVAPLGFEITASAANQRIYRSKDPRRNAVSLFVDDSNTVSGWNVGTNKALTQVKLVCDVVAIDSYVTLGTTWWPKSGAVSGTVARPWMVAGDMLGFYSAVDMIGGGYSIASSHFMQINTLAAGDQFATMLEGAAPNSAAATTLDGVASSGASMTAITHGYRAIARELSQVGVSLPMRFLGLGCIAQYGVAVNYPPFGWIQSGGRTPGLYTYQCAALASVNPADSGLVLGEKVLAVHSPTGATDGTNFTARGVMPGLFSVPAVQSWSMTASIVESPGGIPGAHLLPLPACLGSIYPGYGPGLSMGYVGGYYVDITRNWR